MTELPPEPPREPSEFRRNGREHGGEIDRLDDDQLAELAEEERVDAGIDPYEPDEVPRPPTTRCPRTLRRAGSSRRRGPRSRREEAKGELTLGPDGFPPTRYDKT